MTVKYEVVAVFECNRPEDQIKESITKLEEVVTRNGGTIDGREDWGKRRLAYPINRRREGYYTVVTFDTDPANEVLSELNRHLRISEDLLRYLVTKAVVGKSKGTPPPDDYLESRNPRPGGRRDDRDRGPRRDRSEAPPSAAPVAAPVADAADEAPAAPPA